MSGIVSRVNQGRYDSEKSLLNLRDNAINKNRIDVLDAVNQRLKSAIQKSMNASLGRYMNANETRNLSAIATTQRAFMQYIKIS